MDRYAIRTIAKIDPEYLNENRIDTLKYFKENFDYHQPIEVNIQSDSIKEIFENRNILIKVLEPLLTGDFKLAKKLY